MTPDLLTIKTEIMKRKNILFSIMTLAVIIGGLYGYKEYTRKVKDLSNVKEHVQLSANELITAFEKNEVEANALYLDKIIAVKGNIKAVEKNDKGYYSVILGDEMSMSSIRCSMDTAYGRDISKLKTGTFITIKGACTGFNADELVGSDVILNRCVVRN